MSLRLVWGALLLLSPLTASILLAQPVAPAPGPAGPLKPPSHAPFRLQSLLPTDGYQVDRLTTQFWTETDWSTLFATDYTYDSNGRLVEDVTQSVDFFSGSENLVNAARTTYTYEDGRVAIETTFAWENSAWVPEERTRYGFTGDRLATLVDQAYVNGAWQDTARTTVTYSSSGAVSVSEERVGGAWTNVSRSTLGAENGSTVVLDEVWDAGAWVNELRTVYAMPLDAFIEQSTDLSTGAFSLISFLYFSTSLEMQPGYYEEAWDADAGAWRTSTRMTHEYDAQGRLEVTLYETGSEAGTGWVPESEQRYEYVGGRLASVETYDLLSAPVALTDLTEYAYDANGNPSAITFASDDDGDGALDHASMRFLADWVRVGTDLAAEPGLPEGYALGANYPNPFNPATTIGFTLGHSGPVTLAIYDGLGRRVATLVDGVLPAGTHEVRFTGAGLPSGAYLYRLTTAGRTAAHVMTLAK